MENHTDVTGFRSQVPNGPTETCRCLSIISGPLNFPCLHSPEEGRDRGSSKVSKIATMFQFSDDGGDQDERDVPCGLQAKVVRTESHVARFNTARALFEKMAERGGVGDKGVKASKQRRPSGGATKGSSGGATKGRGTPSPSGGVDLSRSPSPGSNHSQPNGHTAHAYKSSSASSSIATISSTTTPSSTFPPSITNPSIPAVLPLSKKLSDPPAVNNSRWAPTLKAETHKSKPGKEEKPKNEFGCYNHKNKAEVTYKSEIKLTPDFAAKPFMKNGINSKFEVASKEILNAKPEHIHQSASKCKVNSVDRPKPVKTAKPDDSVDRPKPGKPVKHDDSVDRSKPGKPAKPDDSFDRSKLVKTAKPDDSVDKPVKPAKPETLIDKPLSSHLQNQQIIQRHKNWFQSYSKNKSPSSTPNKSLSPSSSNNPTPEPRSPRDLDKTSSYENLFSKGRKSQQSDDELSPIRSTSKTFAGEIQAHRNNLEETSSSLHNDWRKERAAILSGRSCRSGGSTDDGTPSPSDPQKGKTFEEAPTLPSCWSPPKQYNIYTTKTPSHDEAGEGGSYPEEDRGDRVSKRSLSREGTAAPSAVLPTEDRRRSMGDVSLRRRNEESEDRENREKRLREWERRRSLRDYDEAKVHGEEEERKRREEERRLSKIEKKKEEVERKRAEEELERRKREELEKMRLVEEELKRKRKEEEELERKREEERRRKEFEKKQIEEELERKRLEEERKRKEQEEIEKIKREELERRKREEEEIERRKREEMEKRKREELERRRREDEEIERKMREKEELERRKREEEMERRRIEEEIKKKREEEIERKKKEEVERKRIEEIERKRLEEEAKERKRKEIEEIKKKEEIERKKREDLEQKRREEEIERKKREREEQERKRKEEEELRRKKREEEEMERKREIERRKKEKEEMERKKREEEEERKRKIEEELEKKRIFDELERRKEEEILNRQRTEEQEKRRKEEEIRREELERKWQAKRDKLEAEERERRERDRLEIERTKRRIAELKRERDEMQRQQASRLRRLMGEEVQGEERREEEGEREEKYVERKERYEEIKLQEGRKEINEEKKEIYEERKDIHEGSKEIHEENREKEINKELQREENFESELKVEDVRVVVGMEANMEEEEETKKEEEEDNKEDTSTGEEVKMISETQERIARAEEVLYDHTVISAQHKLEFCTSPYNGSHPKEESTESTTPNEPLFSSSTMSSSFEPLPPPNFDSLPPPIPPHNVDPATLAPNNLDSRLPPLPQEEGGLGDPDVMTPEEEKKLLSHKNESRRLLSDVEAKEVSEILSETPEPDQKESEVCRDVEDPTKDLGDDPDGFDKDYDSVYVDSPTPDYEDSDFVFPGTQISEDGFVVRVKEVLIEDGVHYFEDGHFWIQVPGILEEDDDDLPETVAVHKHTKIKFSKEPIKLFSTFSVTDYDRKNEDVDPVAASAEYELEKRVEKMDVFPVQIEKGEGGLGLSIIGMGVGADAGVEKLGIFVKTINAGGATDRDGRIRVNDQIIEVDNESLVGVTQVFAASVLKNTSGTVSFLIGRETDPENSEVAMLIRQSLMADQERDDRRRALEGPNFSPRSSFFESFSSQSGADSPSEESHPTAFPQFKAPDIEEFGGLFPDEKNEFGGLYPGDKDQFVGRYQGDNEEFVERYPGESDEFGGRYPGVKDEFGESYPMEGEEFGGPYTGSGPTSPLGGVTSPPPEAFNHDVNAKGLLQTNEMIIMSQHLQEVQHRNEMYEEEINILRTKIGEVEKELGEKSELAADLRETTQKLKDVENKLQTRQAEVATYQDMLEQSQGQYIILEKKYYKAKKIIKEYQSRERDFLHREEYHITQLEEKDALYNSLVKALKDRVIQLEGDLMNAQQQAGMPVKVPPDLNSQSSNFVQSSAQDNQTPAQKEPPRKPSTISSMDADLSDNEGAETHTSEGSKSSTVERKVPSKEELDGAVPPTELLDNSFSKAKGELASRGGLANRQLPSLKKTSSTASAASFDKALDDPIDESLADAPPPLSPHSTSPTSAGSTIITSKVVHSSSQHEEVFHHSSTSTSTSTSYSNRPPPAYHQTSTHQHPPPYQPPPSAPLSHRPIVSPDTPHGGRGDSQYRHPPPIARVQPVNRVDPPSVTPTHQQQQQQQSLANQLKALLAEREGTSEPIQRGNREGSPIKKSPTSLMEDVRQAVMQADMSIGKKPVISGPIHVSSTAQVVSTGQFVHNRTSPIKNPGLGVSLQQRISRDSGTWSPNLGPGAPPTSPAGGVVLLSQRPIEATTPGGQEEDNASGNRASALSSGDGNLSFDSIPQEKVSGKAPTVTSGREIVSVFDWTKEQVAQWLVVQGLENYVSTFVSAGITGPRLVNIDTKDLKSLGLSSDDKNKIKRKVKDLRQNLEKERKQIEKENKERGKLQKKAEKLAEKAEKRKK